MKRIFLLSLLFFVIYAKEKKVSYSGFKGLQITTPDDKSVNVVKGLKALGVVFMHSPSVKRPCEIAIPAAVYQKVLDTLNENGVTRFTFLYDDLQEIVNTQVEESRKNAKIARYRSSRDDGSSIVTYFPTYEETAGWLRIMRRRYPHLANLTHVGYSYEQRKQYVMKISNKNRPNKPVIWIDGGIHAREWTTVPAVLYLTYKLLSGYATGETKDLLDKYDFYMMPIVNPDGYTYTHEVDRFWRKNRSPGPDACVGVDLNRNFGYKWGFTGVSHDPCDESYLGSAPFSEIETQNMRDELLKLKGRIQMYMNLHAYGELLFIPFAFDNRAYFQHEAEHYRIAEEMGRGITSASGYSTRYRVGKPGNLIYDAAGGTFDWVYAIADAKYAFAAELSPSLWTGGLRGFEMSPRHIKPVVEMVYHGIKAGIEAMN